MSKTDHKSESIKVWQEMTDWWDNQMGREGDDFNNYLVHPSVLELCQIKNTDYVLDISCGNGCFTQKIAKLAHSILAIDVSHGLIEKAKKRLQEHQKVELRVIDCTNESQLLGLGKQDFDIAVCNMALHDIADISPLIQSLPRLLKSQGRFVFSVPHPCFNSTSSVYIDETLNEGEKLIKKHSVKIYRYSQSYSEKASVKFNQTIPYYYFHRSISTLFALCFKAGFIVDGLSEPTPPTELVNKNDSIWGKLTEIPAILVVRCRII